MSPRTEKLYRGLLLAYPSRYRLRFADEIMGVFMESEEEGGPRRGRPSLAEAAALVRHGLAMRLRIRGEPGTWRRPAAGVAGMLVTLVAVMGAQPLLHLSASLVFWHQSDAEPMWLAGVLALATWGLFVLRWQWPAAAAAWASVAAGVWAQRDLVNGIADWGAPLSSTYNEHLGVATSDAQQIALLLPGLLLAVLMLRPGLMARSAEIFGRRLLIRTLLIAAAVIVWTDWAGNSQTWAVLLAGVLLVPALIREHLVLRAGLLIAFAFGYLLAAPQADGSGSRLPRHGWPLVVSLGVIPILVLLAGVVLISQLEASLSLRDKWGLRLEALGRSVRGQEPENAEPV